MIVSRKLNTLLVVSLLAWILVVVDGEGHHPRPQRPQKRNHGNGRNGHPAPKGRTQHVETGVETTTDYVYEEEEAEVLYEEADENYDENYDYMEIPSEMQYGEEAETGMIWDSSQDMYYEAPEETDIEVPDYDDEYEMDVDCAEEAHLEPKFHAKGEPEMHAPPKTGKKSAGKGTEKSSKSKSKKGKGGCKESKKGKKSKKSKKGGGSGDPSMPCKLLKVFVPDWCCDCYLICRPLQLFPCSITCGRPCFASSSSTTSYYLYAVADPSGVRGCGIIAICVVIPSVLFKRSSTKGSCPTYRCHEEIFGRIHVC